MSQQNEGRLNKKNISTGNSSLALNLLINLGFCDISIFASQFDCNEPSSYILVPRYNVHEIMIHCETGREPHKRGTPMLPSRVRSKKPRPLSSSSIVSLQRPREEFSLLFNVVFQVQVPQTHGVGEEGLQVCATRPSCTQQTFLLFLLLLSGTDGMSDSRVQCSLGIVQALDAYLIGWRACSTCDSS